MPVHIFSVRLSSLYLGISPIRCIIQSLRKSVSQFCADLCNGGLIFACLSPSVGGICFGSTWCQWVLKNNESFNRIKVRTWPIYHRTIFFLQFDISIIFQLFRSSKSSTCKYKPQTLEFDKHHLNASWIFIPIQYCTTVVWVFYG